MHHHTPTSPEHQQKSQAKKLNNFFCLAFLAILSSVPIFDLLVQEKPNKGTPADTSMPSSPWFRSLDGIGKKLADFENHIENNATSRGFLRSKLQGVLVDKLSLGTEQVFVTNRGLLFTDDLAWITGPGFLKKQNPWPGPTRRAQSGSIINHPDPRPAIRQFLQDCGARPLILAPLPNKAMFMAASGADSFQNQHFKNFLEAMMQQGATVFWPYDTVPQDGSDAFLTSDTHWTPAFMANYAKLLADFLDEKGLTNDANPSLYKLGDKQTVHHQGDLAHMLAVEKSLPRFGTETVTIQPIRDARNNSWRSEKAAELLLMGDSYLNIYTDAAMGWGANAGLAPQLSYQLQMPLDVIARNGSAPTQTRVLLARRPQPLKGKRAIIWLFAVRDLGGGNWRPVPMPKPNPSAGNMEVQSTTLTVRARLLNTPNPPDPNATPYANAVINLKFQVLAVLEGTYPGEEILASFQIMKDHTLTEARHLQIGKTYQLQLKQDAPAHTTTWTLIDDTETYDLQPWWVQTYR